MLFCFFFSNSSTWSQLEVEPWISPQGAVPGAQQAERISLAASKDLSCVGAAAR